MQTQAGKHQWKPSSYTLLFKRHLFSKDWFSIKLIISDNKCIFWIYYSSKNPKTKYITVSTNIWRNMLSMEACFRHRIKNWKKVNATFISQFRLFFLAILTLHVASWIFSHNSEFISHHSDFLSRNLDFSLQFWVYISQFWLFFFPLQFWYKLAILRKKPELW